MATGSDGGSPVKRAKVDKATALAGLSRLNEAEKTAILERLVKDARLSATKVVCEDLKSEMKKPRMQTQRRQYPS